MPVPNQTLGALGMSNSTTLLPNLGISGSKASGAETTSALEGSTEGVLTWVDRWVQKCPEGLDELRMMRGCGLQIPTSLTLNKFSNHQVSDASAAFHSSFPTNHPNLAALTWMTQDSETQSGTQKIPLTIDIHHDIHRKMITYCLPFPNDLVGGIPTPLNNRFTMDIIRFSLVKRTNKKPAPVEMTRVPP